MQKNDKSRFDRREFLLGSTAIAGATAAGTLLPSGLAFAQQPKLKVGRAGLSPAFFKELQHALNTEELIKLRFLGAERDERAEMCDRIADEGRCVCVGAVGHTALFFRRQTDPQRRAIELPGAD